MLRSEYPRPQFMRKNWLSLNGLWDFDFDDKEEALTHHWEQKSCHLRHKFEVPFCFQSKLSNVHDTSFHDRCFYKREFTLPEEWNGKQLLLHFGAVDYFCKVYIDETLCGEHEGGSASFTFDITNHINKQFCPHSIAVYIEDPSTDETIPRGKQFWEEESSGIWYTRTSGIWQTVWIEPVDAVHITNIKMTPDFDQNTLKLEASFSKLVPDMRLDVKITYEGELVCQDSYSVNSATVFKKDIYLAGDQIFHTNTHGEGRSWSPEHPALYDVVFRLNSEHRICDIAESYFGMRKIHAENGMIYLNNHPYYPKMILDQGYWPDSLLTAPDDNAFQTDIMLMKEMGFNGCRKHQKTADPRFLYWADKIGLMVWEEVPSACLFTDHALTRYTKEWMEVIVRDYNHPSIVAWVPFNESWGVPDVSRNKRQQDYTLSLYYLLKAYDPVRLVVNNDGWEQTKTDICAIHNYAHGTPKTPKMQETFQRFASDLNLLLSPYPAGRSIFASSFRYDGQPIMITECGGIRYNHSDTQSWGYTSAENEDEFLEQYCFVISTILQSDYIYGFCYTQLTDVEQETNGLLTYDRKPKCDPKKIRKINNQSRHNIALIDHHYDWKLPKNASKK